MMSRDTVPLDEYNPQPHDIEDIHSRIHWVTKNLNSDARVALVSENEISLLVRQYLALIADIDGSDSEDERKALEQLKLYAAGRVNEFLLTGSIDRETVNSLCQRIVGEPFRTPFERCGLRLFDLAHE